MSTRKYFMVFPLTSDTTAILVRLSPSENDGDQLVCRWITPEKRHYRKLALRLVHNPRRLHAPSAHHQHENSLVRGRIPYWIQRA
jgi:hypothetical protein